LTRVALSPRIEGLAVLDRVIMKVGAIAAMVGAAIAVVFNVLHP
jgi:hypothetical protein